MHRNQIDDWKILLNHNAPQIKTNQWLLIKTEVKSTFCRMGYQAFQDLKFYFSDLTSSHSFPAQTTSTTLALLLIQHTNFLALLSLYLWINTKMMLSMWPLNNAGSGHFTLGDNQYKALNAPFLSLSPERAQTYTAMSVFLLNFFFAVYTLILYFFVYLFSVSFSYIMSTIIQHSFL